MAETRDAIVGFQHTVLGPVRGKTQFQMVLKLKSLSDYP